MATASKPRVKIPVPPATQNEMVIADGLQLLTKREGEVVRLVAQGMQSREIAQELKLSEHTIKNYLFRIFEKLGVSSHVELFQAVSNSLRVQVARELREGGQTITSYRALVARTVEAFGDEIKASKWLSLPNKDLNGLTPLQLAQANGYSTQSLEPILTRIEHGIYF